MSDRSLDTASDFLSIQDPPGFYLNPERVFGSSHLVLLLFYPCPLCALGLALSVRHGIAYCYCNLWSLFVLRLASIFRVVVNERAN